MSLKSWNFSPHHILYEYVNEKCAFSQQVLCVIHSFFFFFLAFSSRDPLRQNQCWNVFLCWLNETYLFLLDFIFSPNQLNRCQSVSWSKPGIPNVWCCHQGVREMKNVMVVWCKNITQCLCVQTESAQRGKSALYTPRKSLSHPVHSNPFPSGPMDGRFFILFSFIYLFIYLFISAAPRRFSLTGEKPNWASASVRGGQQQDQAACWREEEG